MGAALYDYLMDARPNRITVAEIARDLVNQVPHGRLLDIGSGPGKLLAEIRRINPRIELFGLDISESMIKLAQRATQTVQSQPAPGHYPENRLSRLFS